MTELFNFMDQKETLRFQSVNRWMYNRGVSRVQTKWQGLKRHVYMAHPHDNNKLVEYDACTGAVTEWADSLFDFSDRLVVQVDQDTLYTFKKSDLSTTKYCNLRKVSDNKKLASSKGKLIEFRLHQTFNLISCSTTDANKPQIVKTDLAKPDLEAKKAK